MQLATHRNTRKQIPAAEVVTAHLLHGLSDEQRADLAGKGWVLIERDGHPRLHREAAGGTFIAHETQEMWEVAAPEYFRLGLTGRFHLSFVSVRGGVERVHDLGSRMTLSAAVDMAMGWR